MKKRALRAIRAGLVVGAILSLFSGSAFAQGNIHLGKMKVEPEISYTGEFDDNIFLSNQNEEDDYIHKVRPAITFSWKGARPDNYFKLGYGVDIAMYDEYNDNNFERHMPFMNFGYKVPAGFYLKLEEAFVHTADPYGSTNDYNVGVKTRRWNNTASLTLGYEFADKYAVEVMYYNYMQRYKEIADKWENVLTQRGSLAFFYKLTGKTSVFGQYRYGTTEYDEQNDGVNNWKDNTSQDHTLQDYFVGIRFDPTAKINGELKVGWSSKDMDNSVDKYSVAYSDEETWAVETMLTYKMTDRTTFMLAANRLHAMGSSEMDSTGYVDTNGKFSISQLITNRLSVGGGVGYQLWDYINEAPGNAEKKFDIYSAEANLDYRIQQWLTGGLRYTYKSKQATESQYETDEYDSNVISFILKAMF